MPDERAPDDVAGLRAANARLRGLLEARDALIARLAAELEAARERERLELRLAEMERRLGMDSSNSGTPSSKEGIAAGEERKARQLQRSERERSKDRKAGGQPGHPGKGLARDPDPGERKDAAPPAECRQCRSGLDGAALAGQRWAQSWHVRVSRVVTEWLLPGLECPCCGAVTFAAPPPGLHAGSVSYGPGLNAAAVLLTAYGNVPPERAAQVIAMLLGAPVSAGWVDKAGTRLSALLGKAGLDETMLAALAGQPVLAADETPVNVLRKAAKPSPGTRQEEPGDPEDGKAAPPARRTSWSSAPRTGPCAGWPRSRRGARAMSAAGYLPRSPGSSWPTAIPATSTCCKRPGSESPGRRSADEARGRPRGCPGSSPESTPGTAITGSLHNRSNSVPPNLLAIVLLLLHYPASSPQRTHPCRH
jgi:hypothetical protein